MRGFIELQRFNPAPRKAGHNPHGQGTVLIQLSAVTFIAPVWEDGGDVWSHCDIHFTGGDTLSVNAAFEQIEDAVDAAKEA